MWKCFLTFQRFHTAPAARPICGGGVLGRRMGTRWTFIRFVSAPARNRPRRVDRPTLVIRGAVQPHLHELLGAGGLYVGECVKERDEGTDRN